jgi:hypothetical protein
MAAVRDVPDVTWQEVTACSWHRFPLRGHFSGQKVSSKLKNDAFYAILCLQIRNLSRSDPERRSSGWHLAIQRPETVGTGISKLERLEHLERLKASPNILDRQHLALLVLACSLAPRVTPCLYLCYSS